MILRFAVGAAVLYYWSLPKGTHLSLSEVLNSNQGDHPMKFNKVNVYNTYVQWYHEDGSPFSFHYTAIPSVHHFDTAVIPLVTEKHKDMQVSYNYTSWAELGVNVVSVLVWVVPLFFIPVLLSSFSRPVAAQAKTQNKVQAVKKSMTFTPTFSTTTFKDIVGMHEAKLEIKEFIQFLGEPTRFTKLGAQIPNGALLLGPPGVGKTLLAKAMAGEAKASFIACCGSDFVELYAGMGALRVRKLFEQAEKHAPCIVYIDEIDAIGMKRTGDVRGGGQERENTLNQLLAVLDGFSKKANVITIASTNASLSALDPALVRPGRLDRIVNIDRPLILERQELFEHYLSKINLIPDATYKDQADPSLFTSEDASKVKMLKDKEAARTDLVLFSPIIAPQNQKSESGITNNPTLVSEYASRLAQLCPGFTGADTRNVCNEGAILAVRNSMTFVDIFCLEKAVDRVLAGIEKRSQVLSDFERRVVAHHEAGHAVVGWFLERADPLMKVSIVPRGGKALGYAQYLPSENRIQTEKEMFDDICVCLGGRVAEIVFFNHLSTGAQDDLTKVWKISTMLVSAYGRIPGLDGVSYAPPGQGDSIYSKPYSDAVAQRIDVECKKVVDRAYRTAIEIVEKNKDKAAAIAQHLLTNEVLTRDDVVRILGPRPFKQEGFLEVPMITPMPTNHPILRAAASAVAPAPPAPVPETVVA
jgi:AFG3 family protein